MIPSVQICLEVCLNIPNSLLYILGRWQSSCSGAVLKGRLLKLHDEIHLRQANRVWLQCEKAVDLVHDVLGGMVNHQQVANITEDIGIVWSSFPVCLFLKSQIRISRA